MIFMNLWLTRYDLGLFIVFHSVTCHFMLFKDTIADRGHSMITLRINTRSGNSDRARSGITNQTSILLPAKGYWPGFSFKHHDFVEFLPLAPYCQPIQFLIPFITKHLTNNLQKQHYFFSFFPFLLYYLLFCTFFILLIENI